MVSKRSRLNIYIGDPELPDRVKLAALQRHMTVSEFCEDAIRRAVDGEDAAERDARRERALAALRRIEAIRERTLPLDVPVTELIHEGHDR